MMSDKGSSAHTAPNNLVDDLREALRIRDEFLSIAAHELRNPLTPISVQVAMLLRSARSADPPLPTEFIAGLQRLDRATRRFLNRATVLLDVSRLVAGHPFRPDVSRFNLSELVLELVADQLPVAERLHVKLDTLAIKPDIVGYWDRVGVGLILDNLISNAMKYGAGALVEIGAESLGETPVTDGQLRLWVRDKGPGIAAEDQERIFARFQQAGTNKVAAGGFGVGLWVAREVARGMGGDIRVESQPGDGATFIVVLPRDVAAHLSDLKTGTA
ncbi:MAG TPA: HAMP domain-containing sensor histidine kinase [Rhodopila sp.]|nr:HAMP domain-containing sensor histidine kinase [Rhodopila sp.]